MKKIFLALVLLLGITCSANEAQNTEQATNEKQTKSEKQKYTIKKHHKELGMDCRSCHVGSDEDKYKKVGTSTCKECHSSYEKLALATGHLGYDDNVHASPHYLQADCDLCHRSHEESKNFCVMCHSQESMKKLLVP